jgi:hypothetical protein
MLQIPTDARPREVGIFIAYYHLKVKDPKVLAEMFNYADRTAVDRILASLREKMRRGDRVSVSAENTITCRFASL